MSPERCSEAGLTPRHKAPHYSPSQARQYCHSSRERQAACGLELQHDAPGPEEEDKGQLAGIKTKQQQTKRNILQTKQKNSPQPQNHCPLWPRLPASFGSGRSNQSVSPQGFRGCFGEAAVLQQLCHRCWVGVKLSPWPWGHPSPWLKTPCQPGDTGQRWPCSALQEMAPWQGVGRKNGEFCSSLTCHLSW